MELVDGVKIKGTNFVQDLAWVGLSAFAPFEILRKPGPIDTDMNPADSDFAKTLVPITALQRYGNTDEIASFVAYLTSPEASCITGASLLADGGFAA